jgi:hypothetical protein
MTPAETETFCALWAAGASYREIAQALRCPLGTVASRSAALVAQGKIQSRPRGGRRAQARPEDPPAPPTTPAPSMAPMAPAPPAVTFVAVPEMQELISLVKDLHARVGVLEQTRVPPALPAPPAPPAPPAAERQAIQQWTVRLSKALIDHLKAVAYERRMPPSQLLEELVLKALTDHQPLTP